MDRLLCDFLEESRPVLRLVSVVASLLVFTIVFRSALGFGGDGQLLRFGGQFPDIQVLKQRVLHRLRVVSRSLLRCVEDLVRRGRGELLVWGRLEQLHMFVGGEFVSDEPLMVQVELGGDEQQQSEQQSLTAEPAEVQTHCFGDAPGGMFEAAGFAVH